MLDFYFKYPGVLRRMRQGPLGAEMDTIASDLRRAGYTCMSMRRYLSLMARFSRYAMQHGCSRLRTIDGALVERFLRGPSLSADTASVARSALGHVLRHLARRYQRPVALPDRTGHAPGPGWNRPNTRPAGLVADAVACSAYHSDRL
jgi:hypothetical protein